MPVHIRPDWHLPSSSLTSPAAFFTRRRLMAAATATAISSCAEGSFAENPNKSGPGKDLPLTESYDALKNRPGFPAKRAEIFDAGRPLTAAKVAMAHNNFYEFTEAKSRVWRVAEDFEPRPWTLRIDGEVDKIITLDVDDLRKLGYEERHYRFRCVEAWAMAVPWTGIPLAALLKKVTPKSSARFVAFRSFKRPEQAKGQRGKRYKWPYYEALRIKEAMHPLTMLATGIYGIALPKQHGAPVRLVVPWKYGFKNIKSIERITLMKTRPPTFWNDLVPREYGFDGNVNPKLPHPRWSQAKEKMIGTGRVFDTQWLNGYAAQLEGMEKLQPWIPGWDSRPLPFKMG